MLSGSLFRKPSCPIHFASALPGLLNVDTCASLQIFPYLAGGKSLTPCCVPCSLQRHEGGYSEVHVLSDHYIIDLFGLSDPLLIAEARETTSPSVQASLCWLHEVMECCSYTDTYGHLLPDPSP